MFLILLAASLLSSSAFAEQIEPETAGQEVVAGHSLPAQSGLYQRWDDKRSYGTSTMVSTIKQVAARVAVQMPEASPLFIGDISRHGGGQMFGHTTHQVGQDVDVGLYFLDGHQPHGGFVDVLPGELDLPRTWRLIQAFMDTGNVQFMLLDKSLIDALFIYGRDELGVPETVLREQFPVEGERADWSQRGVMRHAPNHRSHLHIHVTPPPVELGA